MGAPRHGNAAWSSSSSAAIFIGAAGGDPVSGHFNGKIEDPVILSAAIADEQEAMLLDPLRSRANIVAAWDFSRDISGIGIEDVGPFGRHGTLVNLPTRAVVGARWTGREMCWRHAPRDYCAIHFHADDLGDCGWQTISFLPFPTTCRAAPMRASDLRRGRGWLPLYVLPKRAGPRASVVFLASTFTYQAYANHARGNADAAYRERRGRLGRLSVQSGRTTRSMDGRPTTVHLDGSGIAFSSRLPPVLTMRPGFLTVRRSDAVGTAALSRRHASAGLARGEGHRSSTS